jgi:ABC-type Mn2+/Zn2+ transport system ATPase subunit
MKVVAIMGPSGAGKSTLLYALMGTARYGTTRGRLWINGREIRLSRLRRILGYVPQASTPSGSDSPQGIDTSECARMLTLGPALLLLRPQEMPWWMVHACS